MNRFYEGQKVVCISENFPLIACTEKNKDNQKSSTFHPKSGETLVIDEMLGDFLRFDKYDNDSYNWWHCSRFKPLDEIEIRLGEDHFHGVRKVIVRGVKEKALSWNLN